MQQSLSSRRTPHNLSKKYNNKLIIMRSNFRVCVKILPCAHGDCREDLIRERERERLSPPSPCTMSSAEIKRIKYNTHCLHSTWSP